MVYNKIVEQMKGAEDYDYTAISGGGGLNRKQASKDLL